jgi:hypothetical protein
MTEVTVRAVLFGDTDPAAALDRTPGWRSVLDGLAGVLGPVSEAGRRLVDRELAGALGGLLSLDLGPVLVGGWRRHRALVAAAHATRDHPAATEVVQLAPHQITTAHHPSVDLVVNGMKLATVEFDLGLTLDLDGLNATVRRATLVSVQGGRCTVTASLACAGAVLASRQIVIDPAVTVSLGDGIPLLAEEPRVAGVATVPRPGAGPG